MFAEWRIIFWKNREYWVLKKASEHYPSAVIRKPVRKRSRHMLHHMFIEYFTANSDKSAKEQAATLLKNTV